MSNPPKDRTLSSAGDESGFPVEPNRAVMSDIVTLR
jgi:hypothetical protein